MKKLVCTLAGLLLSVGMAGTANAQVKPLYGSDTLFDMTRYLLNTYPDCGGKQNASDTVYIEYKGGGSGTGANEMAADRQEIAPMSSAMSSTQCGVAGHSGSTTAQAVKHSRGAVSMYRSSRNLADQDSTVCAGGELPGKGTNAVGSINVYDVNGVSGLNCGAGGCTGNTYTFASWKDVLAMAYFGKLKDGTYDCNSDVRWALAGMAGSTVIGGFETEPLDCTNDCWENFFTNTPSTGCTDEKCNVNWHIWRRGDFSGTTDTFKGFAGASSTTPFCNGLEGEDNDPIRRPVHVREDIPGRKDLPLRTSTVANDCTGNQGASVTVQNNVATLGWLLPIVVPPPFVKNTNTCLQGSYAWKPQAFKFRPLCEDGGGSAFAQCLAPRDANGNHGCINSATNPSFTTPVGADTRAHNWTQRTADGAIVLDENKREMAAAYYNIHAAHVIPSYSVPTCNWPDSTQQIACLTVASPCSVGFAGSGANKTIPLAKDLEVNGRAPTDALICDTNTATNYPMSRDLFLNSLDGFYNASATSDENALTDCFRDTVKVQAAASYAGFLGSLDCSATAPNPTVISDPCP